MLGRDRRCPRATPASPQQTTDHRPHTRRRMLQANPPHKPRLLVLDEDRIILQSLSQFLKREGYDVRTTDNPADALNQLEAHQTEVLLADVNMPGIKAADFLRDVRRRAPQVVTIVVTGYGSIEGAV